MDDNTTNIILSWEALRSAAKPGSVRLSYEGNQAARVFLELEGEEKCPKIFDTVTEASCYLSGISYGIKKKNAIVTSVFPTPKISRRAQVRLAKHKTTPSPARL